jgi:hypothetical protein
MITFVVHQDLFYEILGLVTNTMSVLHLIDKVSHFPWYYNARMGRLLCDRQGVTNYMGRIK